MKHSIRIYLYCVVGLFTITGISCVETTKYKSFQGNAKDISFYQPVPDNSVVEPIAGNEIRNIILCIGDGMGFNQIALARHKTAGQAGKLWMETLPVTGSVRTFSADSEITDSAAAATAMACGIKTKNGMLGVKPNQKAYASILELLARKGWRTGLTATSMITHATPAGFASHVKSRGSERDIAGQMLDNRVGILFGGGEKHWLHQDGKSGNNLIEAAEQAGYAVVRTRQEMLALTEGPALGLFQKDALTTYAPEPSLAEMAQKAIELLSAKGSEWFSPEPKFFLTVEGSQIDWAGHDNDTDNNIRQTLLFDMAVKEALEFARRDGQTLLIVTADHETGGLVLHKNAANGNKSNPLWTAKDHTAADVPIFAYGPGSQEFSGVMDNTDIAKKIAGLMNLSPFPQEKKKAVTAKSVNREE